MFIIGQALYCALVTEMNRTKSLTSKNLQSSARSKCKDTLHGNMLTIVKDNKSESSDKSDKKESR